MSSFFLLFSSLSILLLVANGQERAPHGLVYENPVVSSPFAVEFLHPKGQETKTRHPCNLSPSCSPLHVAAQVEATEAKETERAPSRTGGRRLGGGGVASIVFCLAFVVILALGAYYVFITREANLSRANSLQHDA